MNRPALLIAFALPAIAAADINVSPMLIEKTVTPEDHQLELTIANTSDTPLTVELFTTPMEHNRKGEAVEGNGAYAYDVSKAIHLPADRITIKPRKWRRIHADVDVPARHGGGYAFIHVRTVPDPKATAMVVASVDFRVIVELNFGAPSAPSLHVEDVVSDPSGLRVAVRNDGDSHYRPSGALELRDPSGNVVFSSALQPENVFPKLTRELKLAQPAPKLQPGRYTAVVTVGSQSVERAVAAVDGQLVVQRAGKP
jgi:hypothetical protein